MNNTKETLSSVKDVIPDIGGNFQLDPEVIESAKYQPNESMEETNVCQNCRKALKSSRLAAMGPRSGRELLEWRQH